jgi:hypothetical protein
VPVYSHPDVDRLRYLEAVAAAGERELDSEQQALYEYYQKKRELLDTFDDRVRMCQVMMPHPLPDRSLSHAGWNLVP